MLVNSSVRAEGRKDLLAIPEPENSTDSFPEGLSADCAGLVHRKEAKGSDTVFRVWEMICCGARFPTAERPMNRGIPLP